MARQRKLSPERKEQGREVPVFCDRLAEQLAADLYLLQVSGETAPDDLYDELDGYDHISSGILSDRILHHQNPWSSSAVL